MEKSSSCLHPNPGWEASRNRQSKYSLNVEAPNMIGKHCILELYGCNKTKLNDEAFIRTTITSAAKYAGATLLNLITHHFEPQGVTGLALLAESHISIHTWPENGYAAIDVFTCGNHTMPEKACDFLYNELSANKYLLKNIERDAPPTIKDSLRNPAIKGQL
tara:strand:+ start:171 stop:656 length:486 start_codon:yes stop_codon:yes gene_type:complete